MKNVFSLSVLLALLLSAMGCQQRPVVPATKVEASSATVGVVAPVAVIEPENLSRRKVEMVCYRDSGEYERMLAIVATEAQAWIDRRVLHRKPGEKLAVVFDIDETALSNWSHMYADDFGYISERWIAWAARAEATAITSVRAVYEAAIRADVEVFFITGRREYQRSPTELNLQRQGYAKYARLFMRPTAGARETAVVFKTAIRAELTKQDYIIIANIGDQESDLAGGFAEKTFKLPNPFYQVD